jgi:outer membrane protein assembly factor BamB
LYVGAGDDGLYCLDAADGKVRWHLEGLHVDANPLLCAGRVYCGSGVGDVYRETAVFCLDAATGHELWRVPTDLPVWAMPTLAEGRLYVGIGNGNFLESAEKPAGAVLCLEAATGKRRWRCDARDGVLARVATAGGRVYFASRDGHCRCVTAEDGAVKWKKLLGDPIVASPAVAAEDGGPQAVYVATSLGQLVCLDADTGDVRATFNVREDTRQEALVVSSPAVAADDAHGCRRVWFACGLDGCTRGLVYCVGDRVDPVGP